MKEVYGEDPYLVGQIAVSYVKGLQGSHPRYVRASSGCKVIGLYSGPENIPSSRFSFDAEVCCIYVTPKILSMFGLKSLKISW